MGRCEQPQTQQGKVSGDRIQKTEEQEGGTTPIDSRHRSCGGILVSRGNVRE